MSKEKEIRRASSLNQVPLFTGLTFDLRAGERIGSDRSERLGKDNVVEATGGRR